MITDERIPGYLIPPELTAVVLMEDHDEAYRAWRNAGLKNQTLLHFDAHFDFKWIFPAAESLLQEETLEAIRTKLDQSPLWNLDRKTSRERIHIGNYIHQAIEDGIVKEFFWIYPDDPDSGKQTQALERIFYRTSVFAPHRFKFSKTLPGCFKGILCGVPFTALPFSRLEEAACPGKVLMDIDLDFFVTQSLHGATYPFPDLNRPCFWLSPEAFTQKISRLKIDSKLTTLAYSVEEGYVPLVLKFLGKELVARLVGPLSESEERKYGWLRGMIVENGHACSLRLLTQIAPEFPGAEVCFSLAMAYADDGDWQRARDAYEKAIREDPTYRTVYNHPGPILWEMKRYDEAAASYARMKKLDPDHPDYRLFDLRILARERKWKDAVLLGKRMPDEGLDSFHLRLILAKCYEHLGRYPEAWETLELKDESFSEDLKFPEYLWLKARIASRNGRIDDAIQSYQKLSGATLPNFRIHARLAGLYFRKRNFYKVRRHGVRAFREWALGVWIRVWKPKDRLRVRP